MVEIRMEYTPKHRKNTRRRVSKCEAHTAKLY